MTGRRLRPGCRRLYDAGHGADQLLEPLDWSAFIQRVHRQRTGYWHPRGDGVEHFTPAELAAAADLLGGGTAAAFHTAAAELTRRGEHELALRILDLGLLSHPGTPGLAGLRQDVLYRLAERNQLLDPFKFAYYAGLADLELAPPG